MKTIVLISIGFFMGYVSNEMNLLQYNKDSLKINITKTKQVISQIRR